MGKKTAQQLVVENRNQKSQVSKKVHPVNSNRIVQKQEFKSQIKDQVDIVLQNQLHLNKSDLIKNCIDLIDSEQEYLELKTENQNRKRQHNQSQQIDLEGTKFVHQVIDIEDMTYFVPVYQHKNYHTHIREVLLKFAGKETHQINLDQITKAITYFRQQFMVHRQNRIIIKKNSRDVGFQIINNFHSNLAKEVFSKLTRFILQKQHDQAMYRIPIFQAGRQLCQNITKWQALYIMCCMTMCLIIEQKSDVIGKMYRFTHFIEFTSYFSQNEWKTRCILEYLRTQLSNYYEERPREKSLNQRRLTIKRSICPVKVQKIMETEKQKSLKGVNVPNDDVTVDDYYQELKLCHTNEVIGGGQALGGLSQQDIFFSAHTELHILIVLCEQMNISDCINLVGFRKYFRIERTKYEIVFQGQDTEYPLDLDEQLRVRDYISFVNHPKLMREHFREQFKKEPIDREIAIYYGAIKSFLSIPHVKFSKVISGHWACLIQWGDPRKKITSLWMACAMNNKDLTFCPYGQFKNIYDKDFFFTMKQKPVPWVYEKLLSAGKKMMIFRDNLHVFMLMVMDH